MMDVDAETRVCNDSSGRAVRDGKTVNFEEDGDYMEIEKEGYDGELLGNKDTEKSRESGKHRSKDRKNGRREEKDYGNKDRERSKDREHDKDRDRDKERSRDKVRDKEKDYDRDKYREKDRGKEHDRDKELDREREWSFDRERGRGRDHGKDRGREREKDREGEKERDSLRGKEREKVHDSMRDREKDRDRDQDRDKGRDRSKVRERDHEKEMERERVKEKDRERGHDREREREKDRDRVKGREKEKEKIKDHEKEEKEKEREKDKLDKDKGKEKPREKEIDRNWDTDRDKSRTRDREREIGRGKEGEKADRTDVDGRDGRVVAKEEVDDEGDNHERTSSKHHDEKPASQSAFKLEERLIKMKQERLKRKSDDSSEILSWVNKSRRIDEKRKSEKEKVARLSKFLEEQDNIAAESEDEEAAGQSGKDLAGVKILHGLDKVIEGGAVVLTLKDQNILADGDINEEVDMLENVEIGEQKHRDEAYKAAKKKTGIYEDKFSEDTGSRKTILPQYDDPIEDEGVTLDESGRFTGEAEKKLEELRKRIEGGSTKKEYEDLTSSAKSLSDYYTPDEMLQFKKPKKKKSFRKKEKLDLDALEAEAISSGLGAGDLGSRKDLKRQSAKEEEAKAEAEMRSNAYQSALAKAEEASKLLRQEQTLTVKTVEDDNLVFGEDYEDLQKSLEQARKLALKSQEEAAASGPQAVALLAAALKEKEDTQSSTAGEPQEDKVVITEMGEFVLGLQFNEEIHKPESEDVFMDEEDNPKFVEQEMDAEVGGWTEVKENNNNELPTSEEKEDITPDEIIHEVAVGKGLGSTLKLLKERGTLKEGPDWGGRNMDKKKSKLVGINDNDGPKEIRIERTDEFGRIMTPKEAFRIISHKFHGKGPGKMKQEKRMKQYQEDLKTKRMKASDTPSLAMERMREAQARLKSPYLVLSGHVKPGQTSDPRSGFATVEKDHLGSLTPMLGDKKVEHFLGISRKHDAGSMGPPPPKKPKS